MRVTTRAALVALTMGGCASKRGALELDAGAPLDATTVLDANAPVDPLSARVVATQPSDGGVVLSVFVSNRSDRACRVATSAFGTMLLDAVERDGVRVVPELGIMNLDDSLDSLVRASLVTLAPGVESAPLELRETWGEPSPRHLFSASLPRTPVLTQGITLQRGHYKLSLRYWPGGRGLDIADACSHASLPLEVELDVR